MPAGWDSYSQAVYADGPAGWYRFSELLAGSTIAAGSQDPQNLCFDSSSSGNLNQVIPPYPNGNVMTYGSAVLSNQPSLLSTNGPPALGVLAGDAGGAAVFPNTATQAAANIVTAGSAPQATGTFTITGSPTTGQNNGYTIGGTLVNAPQATANTVTQQATADVLVINANTTVNKIIVASSVNGVITITALTGGPSGNLITIAGTGNAGDTVTASGTTLTGGTGIQSQVQPTILQPTAGITVAAWHKPGVINGSTKQVAVCYGSDAASLAPYCLFHTGAGATTHAFNFAVNIGGTLKTATATTPLLVAGTTQYAVGTYDGVNVRIFVNGVLRATTAATGAISYANAGGFGLALGNDPSLTDANIQGTLDEVAIYSYALSATRIAYHYRQGSTFLPFVWNH